MRHCFFVLRLYNDYIDIDTIEFDLIIANFNVILIFNFQPNLLMNLVFVSAYDFGRITKIKLIHQYCNYLYMP